jgi:hypothetical protein
VKQVKILLKAVELQMDEMLKRAKATKVEQLAQEYARREPDAIEQITKLLATNGRTVDDLWADALINHDHHGLDLLTTIERIDHRITVAETRRNAMLREIDRRHALLGEALRQSLQVIESEYKVIEKKSGQARSAA